MGQVSQSTPIAAGHITRVTPERGLPFIPIPADGYKYSELKHKLTTNAGHYFKPSKSNKVTQEKKVNISTHTLNFFKKALFMLGSPYVMS